MFRNLAAAILLLPPLVGCHHRPADQVSPTGELKNVKAASVEELLEGRFPGVQVLRTASGGVSIRIRTASSIYREPLYVVDGIAFEVEPGRGLDWLNPSEIARIDVLKNATDTTMYGARGANGVIVITTKKR